MADRKSYEDFLQEADKEKSIRDKVLKRGVVHEIHMAEDSVSNYYTQAEINALFALYYTKAEIDAIIALHYTKAEIDAIIAALGGLDTCISTPIRHDFLMYDGVNLCWKNQFLEMDFEDTIDYTCTNLWMAINALIRFEDSYTGDGIIIEDTL